MLRLFIGIPIPDSYRERLETVTQGLAARLRSRIKWTKPDNAHITLKFLGDVNENCIDDLINTLEAVLFPTFQLRAGGWGCFPNTTTPRVLWAGVMKGAQSCTNLAAQIEQALHPLGYQPENKPFKCHLTLGRVKQHAQDNWAEALKTASGIWPGFTVTHFTLWQSRLTPQGAMHIPLKEFPLLNRAKAP